MAMLEEGVDIGDRRAVDAWIAVFNRRPRAQRDSYSVICSTRPA
jgi:hypothetical protein